MAARDAITLGDSLNPFSDTPAEQAAERAGRERFAATMALDENAGRARSILFEVVRRHAQVLLVLHAETIWLAVRGIHVVSGGRSSCLVGQSEALQQLHDWRQRALALVPLVSPTEVVGALASYDFDVYLRR